METPEWTVRRPGAYNAKVVADGWRVGPSGDLVFFNESSPSRQGVIVRTEFPLRAFAAGQWEEVSLYA